MLLGVYMSLRGLDSLGIVARGGRSGNLMTRSNSQALKNATGYQDEYRRWISWTKVLSGIVTLNRKVTPDEKIESLPDRQEKRTEVYAWRVVLVVTRRGNPVQAMDG